MRFRNDYIHELLPEFLQPLRYFGRRRGSAVPPHGPFFYYVFFFKMAMAGTRFLRSRSSALVQSIDAGIGIDLVLSSRQTSSLERKR